MQAWFFFAKLKTITCKQNHVFGTGLTCAIGTGLTCARKNTNIAVRRFHSAVNLKSSRENKTTTDKTTACDGEADLASDAMKNSTSPSFPVGVTPYVPSSSVRSDEEGMKAPR